MCPGGEPKALRGKKMSPGPESHTDSLSHLFPVGTLPVCLSGFTLEFQGEADLAGGRLQGCHRLGWVVGLDGH